MSTVTISAADVNKLRQQTGAGMMDCRKALMESEGDFEKAIDYLRKKGQKVAANRSDRDAKEGVVIAKASSDNTYGVIVNLSSETDFVSKNAEFIAFANDLTDIALNTKADSIDTLKAAAMEGATVGDKLLEMVAKIGEKIDVVRRCSRARRPRPPLPFRGGSTPRRSANAPRSPRSPWRLWSWPWVGSPQVCC